jgi:transposase-like protein
MVDRPVEPANPGKANLVALAIASGSSIRQTAKDLGLHESTIRKWMKNPSFKAKVEKYRCEFTDQTIGRLSAASSAAVGMLVKLMAEGESDQVKLGAARAILDKLPLLSEFADLTERLRRLEQQSHRPEEPSPWA